MESLIGSNVDIKELYNVEATIQFTNPTKLKRAITTFCKSATEHDSLGDHTILVTGFPADRLPNNDISNKNSIPCRGKTLFFTDSKSLIFTMVSGPHEKASRLFLVQLDRKLVAMNCEEELIPSGGTQQTMTGVAKEPDESWGPQSKDYITLAVETGVSESNSALAHNAKIWLEHTELQVTQVLTIKISRVKEEVTFCVWKAPQQEREIRSRYPPRAAVDHSVLVTLEDHQPVANGTITISFEEAFERKPRQGTAEKDFVFSARELGGIARLIFQEIGSIPRH